ncbi:CDP-glycerol glycerophosphotransferase family protein [Pseudoalteromonas sp. H105]|uniref:CDP-glycerol glycerophosphotransferase family protein n=1 Tax=Pseudoalteromonas sp. H105 TaxID=1348393 RepID=UPI0007320A5C|nr:CDP-glycerol glycerophosphotransferase family protein [Pseudoalteromonas sp. H105]KTF15203.1 hypothetical protein ATS75_10460 [Pseudoalteromonas sp. H105]
MVLHAFFPTYGGGHVKSVIPVIKRLNECGHNVEILGLTNSVVELSKAKLNYTNLSNYAYLFSKQEQDIIIELGQLALIGSAGMLVDTESVWYHGIGLYELCKSVGEKDAFTAYRNQGRKAFLPKGFALKVLRSIKPDFVFVTCGQRLELAFAYAANELAIPVFRLIDLVGYPAKVDYKATMLVGNEYTKKILLEALQLRNEIIVTGNPNFEHSSKVTTFSSDICVTYFSQPGLKDRNSVLAAFGLLLNKQAKLKFTYKPHPSENLDDIDEINSLIEINKDQDANELIAKSDLVITHFSSVGFQAINQNKKLLIINFESKIFPIDFVSMGCAKVASSVNELISLLVNFTDEKKVCFDAQISNYPRFQQPSSATEKVVDTIFESFKGI